MIEFIKPLAGVIIIGTGLSIAFIGISFASHLTLFDSIATVVFIFLGALISEVGCTLFTEGSVRESIAVRLFSRFTNRQ